jgi:hypothetical protein
LAEANKLYRVHAGPEEYVGRGKDPLPVRGAARPICG